MKPFLLALSIGLALLGFAFWLGPAHAQSCMQMGQMYQCTDGTQGMSLGGGLGAFSNPRTGTQGQTMDIGGGLSTFNDNTGRSGTQFDQRGLGQWQDNRGNMGTYQDLGPAFRNFQPSTPYQPSR